METRKWNSHVHLLTNKLSKVSFMIKSSKDILSLYMFRNVYFTKLQALLRCGILIWGAGRDQLIQEYLEYKKG